MKIILWLLSITFAASEQNYEQYSEKREKMLSEELRMSIGGNMKLNENESIANELLMKWKRRESDVSYNNPHEFQFSHSYFEFKNAMERSKVYRVIKAMPKGAALHLHATALLGPDFFVNVTYKDNLYVCFDDGLQFKFAYTKPEEPCHTQWKLMSDVRKTLDAAKFDADLRGNFTLMADDVDTSGVWGSFRNIFRVTSNLWTHRPVWEEYVYEALTQLREDNILYAEFRSFLPNLYELDGTRHHQMYFVNVTKAVVDRFVADHGDFVGAKIICSFGRTFLNDPNVLVNALALSKEAKRTYPDFVAGFDLVGLEDSGTPLIQFLPQLQAAKAELDFFFHAGETNWFGTPSDENLLDAILLGSKRIGHAYSLLKHPLLLEEVRRLDIALEVNVLSNCVLGLTRDVRDHPVSSYIARGLPVVVSSDDPGLWGAPPLAADLFAAFAAAASRRHDLRLLKQLALNSIRYSALNGTAKGDAYKIFDSKWNTFIDDLVREAKADDKVNEIN